MALWGFYPIYQKHVYLHDLANRLDMDQFGIGTWHENINVVHGVQF